MLRALILAMTLLATAPVLVDQAFAATQEELDLMKAEVDYADSTLKAVEKLADDYQKNLEKDKDNKEVVKELKSYFRAEIQFLREQGIEIQEAEEAPDASHPAHPKAVIPEPEEEREKLVELRDLVLELKGGELKPKPFGTKLTEYVKILRKRSERKAKFYESEKEKSK